MYNIIEICIYIAYILVQSEEMSLVSCNNRIYVCVHNNIYICIIYMYKYSTCIYILVQFEVAYKYCHYTAPIMRYMHYNIQ